MEAAQNVSRRLQDIGVSADHIALKTLERGDPVQPEGVFVSAKVAPDQLESATEILKGPAGVGETPSRHAGTGSDNDALRGTSEKAVWPPPVAPKPADVHRSPADREDEPAVARRSSPMRLLMIFAAIVAAGIILGYLLGSAA